MLQLRQYRPSDAEEILSWITDAAALQLWSANRFGDFPASPEIMNGFYDSQKIYAVTAYDELGVAGHFTMRHPRPDDFSEIRLGFIILRPDLRKRGYGKQLVSLAIEAAFLHTNAKKITLGVFVQNAAAKNCYLSCGMKEIPRFPPESYVCMGETWNCVEMEIEKNRDKSQNH